MHCRITCHSHCVTRCGRTPAHTSIYNRYLVGSVCRHSVSVDTAAPSRIDAPSLLSTPPRCPPQRRKFSFYARLDARTYARRRLQPVHYTLYSTRYAASAIIQYPLPTRLQTAYYPHGRFYAKIFGGLASPSSSLPISYPSPSSLPLEVGPHKYS